MKKIVLLLLPLSAIAKSLPSSYYASSTHVYSVHARALTCEYPALLPTLVGAVGLCATAAAVKELEEIPYSPISHAVNSVAVGACLGLSTYGAAVLDYPADAQTLALFVGAVTTAGYWCLRPKMRAENNRSAIKALEEDPLTAIVKGAQECNPEAAAQIMAELRPNADFPVLEGVQAVNDFFCRFNQTNQAFRALHSYHPVFYDDSEGKKLQNFLNSTDQEIREALTIAKSSEQYKNAYTLETDRIKAKTGQLTAVASLKHANAVQQQAQAATQHAAAVRSQVRLNWLQWLLGSR